MEPENPAPRFRGPKSELDSKNCNNGTRGRVQWSWGPTLKYLSNKFIFLARPSIWLAKYRMPRASTLQICKSRTCSRWSASGSSIVWWMAAKCLVKSFVVSFANLGGLLKAQFRNLRECKGARNKFLEPQTGFSWCERGPSTWDRNLPVLIRRQFCHSRGASRGSISEPT